MNNIEDAFDENKVKKAIRKAKLKLILKIIIVSIAVFIVGSYVNYKLCIKYSKNAYEANEAYIKASVPNGYISESNDICGFLGGSGTYKIAKEVGRKTVILEDRINLFGINPPMNYSVGQGGSYSISSDEWPVSLWEFGYKKMRFFHPELKYKEYQNDLEKIDSLPDGKIIEMGISFDRPYKLNEMDLVLYKFKDVNVTWAWLNEFEEKKIDEFQKEIKESDARASGIMENDIVGINIDGKDYAIDYDDQYDELLDNLNKSRFVDHNNLYKEIMKRGKTSKDDAEVLGIVVYGTKEELGKLKGNPIIKASSFGVLTDKVY